MPFARPTRSQLVSRIRTAIETQLPGADSRLRRSFLDVLSRAMAAVADGLYGFLGFIALQPFEDTAEEEFLRRRASIYGLAEIEAAAATGNVTLSGLDGSVIPAGSILRREDGTGYSTLVSATIASGVASVAVSAVVSGESGNADAGVGLKFLSPIPNVAIEATVAVGGLKGGRDPESVESLRARLLDRIRNPPSGGTVFDYIARAKLYAGVTDVYVFTDQVPDVCMPQSGFTSVDTEVDGDWVARGTARKAKLIIALRATALANGETVSITANLQDATSSGGAGAADFGPPITNQLIFTAPGAGGPHAKNLVYEAVFNVSAARSHLRSQVTVLTSSSGTLGGVGVTLELQGEPGTVSVAPLFYDRPNPIPEAGDITAIQALLTDPVFMPVTAKPNTYALTPNVVPFTIGLNPDTAAIRDAIQQELKDLFRRESVPGGRLLISHIREAISLAAGEFDHELTTPTADIDLAGNVTQISTVGTITWT